MKIQKVTPQLSEIVHLGVAGDLLFVNRMLFSQYFGISTRVEM